MWIVSQDGTNIVNADAMRNIDVSYCGVAIYCHDGYNFMLGGYSSHKKALAVRDRLIAAYRGVIIMKNMDEKTADTISDYLKPNKAVYCIEGVDIEPLGNLVFQMPKDEEVSV